MVQGAARGRHRGHPRRRLQPHRRGQPPRARRCASAASTTPPTTGSSTATGALLRHHRHRQHAAHAPPARAAADHGLAALLGDRDARRRLPLRPRLHPGPAVPRGRPALGVLRPGAAGPGRQPGQAHRRAVGRRRGRLPGRQLPAAVDGVERQVPRHRARLLARRARHARRVRLAAHRLLATSTRTRRPQARSPRSTSSPPTTASRCATWSSYNDKHNDANGEGNRTARATTGRGTAAPRARPTTPRSSRCASPQQRNFLATLLLSQGVPMICHGDELGRTQGGTAADRRSAAGVHVPLVERTGRRLCAGGGDHGAGPQAFSVSS